MVGLIGMSTVPAQEAATEDAAGAVHYDRQQDRLSVSVRDQPLVGLFERISTATGVGVVVHGADHGAITADFDDLPLELAIKQLLEGRNYALSGAADPGQGLNVWIMAPRKSSPRTPQARLRAPRQTARRTTTTRRTARTRRNADESSQELLQLLTKDSEAAENLQKLLSDENALGDLIRNAMQDGEVPPELLEIIEDGMQPKR